MLYPNSPAILDLIEYLEKKYNTTIIFASILGSHVWGYAVEESDIDIFLISFNSTGYGNYKYKNLCFDYKMHKAIQFTRGILNHVSSYFNIILSTRIVYVRDEYVDIIYKIRRTLSKDFNPRKIASDLIGAAKKEIKTYIKNRSIALRSHYWYIAVKLLLAIYTLVYQKYETLSIPRLLNELRAHIGEQIYAKLYSIYLKSKTWRKTTISDTTLIFILLSLAEEYLNNVKVEKEMSENMKKLLLMFNNIFIR